MGPSYIDAAEAWTAFWAEQGQTPRCMAGSAALCETLDAHWRNFGSRLPSGTRVIDLGCGSGAVGRALLSADSHLHVTGIDYAQVPASKDPRSETLSNVSMESLPFTDGAFGAAVSQFGYEYGRAEQVANELARVLVRGAPFCFLIHHPDGPIVADLRRHRRAIEGLCGPRVQSAFFSGNAQALAYRIAEVKRECANDPIVGQAERGLRNHLRDDELHRLQVWKAVVDALIPELIMLDSLELCRTDCLGIDHLVKPLAAAFDMEPPAILRDRAGESIAWIIHGQRR